MEGFRECDETVPVFTLADLNKIYASILENLGVDQAAQVHTTRLRKKLESEKLDLMIKKHGQDTR